MIVLNLFVEIQTDGKYCKNTRDESSTSSTAECQNQCTQNAARFCMVENVENSYCMISDTCNLDDLTKDRSYTFTVWEIFDGNILSFMISHDYHQLLA